MKTKGLEPIVAAVLLIVVAVIGAVLIYLWFAGYVTKTTSQAEQMAASEKLKIEAANLTDSTRPTAILYVRNLGGTPVNITTAYLLKAGTSIPECSPVTINPPVRVDPNSLQRISVSFSGCSVKASQDYTIKLVTAKGTEIATTVTASSAS